ncbi:MAG: hypothetical protein GX146_03070 [Myxococcales bacterium]|nr:hypothetical protein [Myxococcales bacterium]
MKRLNAWLDKTATRAAKRPNLRDALLGIRSRGYVWYRLRFLSIRALLRFVLHLAEMLILVRLFLPELLAPVLFIRSWMAFAAGSWWGGLEQMRDDVRHHAAQRQWSRVRQTIDAWMGLAFVLSAAGLAVGTGLLLGLRSSADHHFDVFDAYILACLLRTAFDIIGRTWHSGLFALRRVYRPLWSLLVGDVLDVGLALALWPWFGPWGFGIALLVAGIARLMLLVFFVNRGLAQSLVPCVRWGRAASAMAQLFSRRGAWGWLRHTMANVVLQLDALVTMGLAAAVYYSGGDELIAIVFYIVRPVFNAGHAWSRLFYFDYSLLRRRFDALFLHRYDALLRRTAFWFSTAVALLCALLSWWLLGGTELRFPLILGALAIMRSFLGILQMRSFALHAHKHLLISGFFVIAVAVVLPNVVRDADWLFLGLLLAMSLASVWLYAHRDVARAAPMTRATFQHPVAFVSALKSVAQPLDLFCAEFCIDIFSLRRIALALHQANSERVFCPLNRRTLLWYQPAAAAPVEVANLAVHSAGTLARVRRHVCTAAPEPLLSAALGEISQAHPRLSQLWQQVPEGLVSLAAEFRERFPEGQMLTAERGALGALSSPAAAHEFHALLRDEAHFFHRVHHNLSRAKTTVIPYAPNDRLQCLFAVPQSAENTDARHLFADRVLATSLRETLGTTLRDIVVPVSQIDA